MQTHTGVMGKLPSQSSFGTDPDATFHDTVGSRKGLRIMEHISLKSLHMMIPDMKGS